LLTADTKGQIGLLKICHRITELGYTPFLPFGEPKDRVDLIAKRGQELVTIQSKYMTISRNTIYITKRSYVETDFQFFGIYISDFDKVIFVPSKLMGRDIKCILNGFDRNFYWWEDFIGLSQSIPIQKTLTDFPEVKKPTTTCRPRPWQQTASKPSSEILQNLLLEHPASSIGKMFDVSGVTIAKWAKQYNLSKPSRGYWQKVQAGKIQTAV
jgi:hypothetical protein